MPGLSWTAVVWHLATVLMAIAIAASAQAQQPAQYVIHISVDGLGSVYLDELLSKDRVPTFKRLQKEAAWTHNARTDADYTITLPNHTCMVTARAVSGSDGHNWSDNSDPKPGRTLHSHKPPYVCSTFDVAHDAGLPTAMFAGKTKFSLFDVSYNARNGAPDKTGDDNGNDKLDTYVMTGASDALTKAFIEKMSAEPFGYVFIHYAAPDSAGHAQGWGSEGYNRSVIEVDQGIGQILKMVDDSEKLRGKTAIIITADHGGLGKNHQDPNDIRISSIPFYVWGAGVKAGTDLYKLNPTTRKDPANNARPKYTDPVQPIRNGDSGNLALDLLGLRAIPGSTINAKQDLAVAETEDK